MEGKCSHTIHHAHKTSKVLYGLTAKHGQKGEKKKGAALKVVTGQGSSFEGEERKGVRKSEKGRKQTTLISHLPPSPTRVTPPIPSRINFPSQGLLYT